MLFLVLRLLLFFFLLLPFLAAFFLLLAASILFHGVSVQLEQLPCVKFGKIRNKKPEGAFPILPLLLGHLHDEAVNVFANLD